MHLRDAELGRDLRLRQLVEETELDDAPLALVERVEAGVDERSLLDVDVPSLLDAEAVREGVVAVVVERGVQRAGRVRVRRVEGVDHLFLLGSGCLRELGDRR